MTHSAFRSSSLDQASQVAIFAPAAYCLAPREETGGGRKRDMLPEYRIRKVSISQNLAMMILQRSSCHLPLKRCRCLLYIAYMIGRTYMHIEWASALVPPTPLCGVAGQDQEI